MLKCDETDKCRLLFSFEYLANFCILNINLDESRLNICCVLTGPSKFDLLEVNYQMVIWTCHQSKLFEYVTNEFSKLLLYWFTGLFGIINIDRNMRLNLKNGRGIRYVCFEVSM